MTIQSTHDHLALYVQHRYTLDPHFPHKRHYFDTGKPMSPQLPPVYFTFTCHAYLPLHLSPYTWAHYTYSIDDIKHTFKREHDFYLWTLTLLFNFQHHSCDGLLTKIQPHSTYLKALTARNPPTLDQLLQLLQASNFAPFHQNTSKLCHDLDQHKPLLPLFKVPSTIFQQARTSLPPSNPSFLWSTHYNTTITFQDRSYIAHNIHYLFSHANQGQTKSNSGDNVSPLQSLGYIPQKYQHKSIKREIVWLSRIVPIQVYNDLLQQHIRLKPSLLNLTNTITHNNTEYVVLEEGCLIE